MKLTTSLCLLLSLGATPADAQIGSLIKKKAAEAAKEATKSAPKDTAKTTPKPAADSAKPGATPASQPAGSAGAASPKADPKVWENYDFVPGSKVLFYTDFSEDKVGNFARGMKYLSGAMEVVERDDVKMLRATSPGALLIPVGRKLPQRFTIEVDVLMPAVGSGGFDLVTVEGGTSQSRAANSAEVNWNVGAAIMGGGQGISSSQLHLPPDQAARFLGQLVHLRILMDSAYFKMYANEKRLYNIPELQFKRDTVIRLGLRGAENAQALFVTAIRVAESETDVLYDALANKGRWATQGILFATGKAELQPESRPVLKEIASTLKKYGDLKILIEGHTDNVGSSASNLSLSDARAAAVKAALVADFAVAGDRITTKGFGDTKPSAPNTSATGRAQNRRVEIVKQ